MDDNDDLDIALKSSDRAAELALEFFEAGVPATRKADGSPVTEADRTVERSLREQIAIHVPDDAFLGEEFGEAGSSDRVWILDPIDGTSSFIKGNPNWRVHVALQVHGRIDAAVVTAPAIRRQWWAARGRGAFESSWPRQGGETPLAVSATTNVNNALLDALGRAARSRLPQQAEFASKRSSAWCSGLMDLLRGDVDCYLAECCQVWDHAPWILLVEEAGGRFTNRTGGRSGAERGGLYSNAGLHDQLLDAIGYPAAD